MVGGQINIVGCIGTIVAFRPPSNVGYDAACAATVSCLRCGVVVSEEEG
jgi:hypothetical protein